MAKNIAYFVHRNEKKWIHNPFEYQQRTFTQLIETASNTKFGKDHEFKKIKSHQDYIERVPIRDYEGLKPYIERVLSAETDVLWPGKPLYLAKTSGTTSGAKYIPLTRSSMPYHIKAARNTLLNYIYTTGKANFFDGKMIFLQGSPVLEEENGIAVGRLSGIVAHYVPPYLQKNRLPSWQTNCIENWEEKVDKIIDETLGQDLRLISGIPPWVQMYFEKMVRRTGKKVGEIFPNFNLFVTGGVNYSPYEELMNDLIGRKVDVLQTYPASEGFIAYQDTPDAEDLLLLLNGGVFFEFVPLSEIHKEKPTRLTIKEVEMNVDYAIILSTNAGLWAYDIGDTIRFTSLLPYKIIVSGRTKHYTSAFGEHVIASEVEGALKETVTKHPCSVVEFTVAPQVNPEKGLPYHEWLIEFEQKPENIKLFCQDLDRSLQKRNVYYKDLIEGKILKPLEICVVNKNGFKDYMKSIGKLGGQNKVPRLTNDRIIAQDLKKFSIN